ncbi:MAG: right-handed parallel beta-helix repeat-containing protein, partial [Verrucomicrobiae bacterium]|nr:right-handed parallel beta-helix repeat-containing protein [Verrucomicrobiae bacterium]
RFYFLNLLEEIDQPGEWYIDRKTGILYFWPPADVDLKVARPADEDRTGAGGTRVKSEIVLSILEGPLVRFDGASHVRLEGVVLEATRGNGVEMRGGTSNCVAGCVIRNIGNNGVVIEGGTGHGVVGCDVIDTGDGGVTVSGGDRQTLTSCGHFVENCHFQRQGRWSKCYVPAVLIQGVGIRASHNLIHDHPHCAILFGGNDHLIEFNEIHHIALETGDVGAIYTGRDYTFRGNKIVHNYIHHTGGVGMGSMGVYMDDCVSGTEIFGNVFYKVQRAVFIGGGRDHRVENNLFVDCDPAISIDGRGLDKSPVWRNMVNDYMRGRLKEVPADLYRARYPELKSLDVYYGAPGRPPIQGESFNGIPPENNQIVRNVCVGKWIETGWGATREMLVVKSNLTDAGSSLAKALDDRSPVTDFELQPDSPVWQYGFKRIPVEKIGLRREVFRLTAERLALMLTNSTSIH